MLFNTDQNSSDFPGKRKPQKSIRKNSSNFPGEGTYQIVAQYLQEQLRFTRRAFSNFYKNTYKRTYPQEQLFWIIASLDTFVWKAVWNNIIQDFLNNRHEFATKFIGNYIFSEIDILLMNKNIIFQDCRKKAINFIARKHMWAHVSF